MAQIADKLAAIAIGDNPIGDSDYVARSDPGINTSAMVAASGADDPLSEGKIWEITHSAPGVTRILDETITHADIDVLALIRRTSASNEMGLMGRVPPTSGTTGYFGILRDTAETIGLLGGGTENSTDPGLGAMVNTWQYVRLRLNSVNPTTCQLTVWDLGESEPGTPQLDFTDATDVETSGHPGLYFQVATGSAFDVAYLSVGTDGDVALLPGEGAGGETIERTNSDTFTFADSIGIRDGQFTRSLAESFTFTEAITDDKQMDRAASESFTFAENIVDDSIFTRGLRDAFTFAENFVVMGEGITFGAGQAVKKLVRNTKEYVMRAVQWVRAYGKAVEDDQDPLVRNQHDKTKRYE